MINHEDRALLMELKENQPNVYSLFQKIEDKHKQNVSKASHDIKNIISTMGSSFQFIEMKHPEAKNYKFWSQLGDSIKFLTEFMDQTSIFRYSSTVEKQLINIDDILYTIPECLDEIFDSENRCFHFNIGTPLPAICADSQKIKYALIELAKNAFEASTENDTIELGACVNNDYTAIIVSVSNCGDDIHSDIADKIKTPFYTTKTNHTGVGIPIAEEIANAHGGNFNLISRNGKTTAYISLPL